jgi:putative copper export protein
LRAFAFVLVVHAAGLALFRALAERYVPRSAHAILTTARWSAAAALAALVVHRAFEPARVMGRLDGLWDGSLHALLWSSDAGTAAALQALGLVVLLVASLTLSAAGRVAGVAGAALVAASFALTGHTATHGQRWLLAPVLTLHVSVVAFWFGALWPLFESTRRDSVRHVAVVVERFSAVALGLVPLIFVAGLVLSVTLVPSLAQLRTPYGVLLLGKVAAFAVLMALAGLNNRRYGPAIADGDAGAVRSLGISVRIEWAIIALVLIATAAMTSLFAPTAH